MKETPNTAKEHKEIPAGTFNMRIGGTTYAAMFRVGISFIFSRIKSRSASVTRNFSCTVLFRPSML